MQSRAEHIGAQLIEPLPQPPPANLRVLRESAWRVIPPAGDAAEGALPLYTRFVAVELDAPAQGWRWRLVEHNDAPGADGKRRYVEEPDAEDPFTLETIDAHAPIAGLVKETAPHAAAPRVREWATPSLFSSADLVRFIDSITAATRDLMRGYAMPWLKQGPPLPADEAAARAAAVPDVVAQANNAPNGANDEDSDADDDDDDDDDSDDYDDDDQEYTCDRCEDAIGEEEYEEGRFDSVMYGEVESMHLCRQCAEWRRGGMRAGGYAWVGAPWTHLVPIGANNVFVVKDNAVGIDVRVEQNDMFVRRAGSFDSRFGVAAAAMSPTALLVTRFERDPPRKTGVYVVRLDHSGGPTSVDYRYVKLTPDANMQEFIHVSSFTEAPNCICAAVSSFGEITVWRLDPQTFRPLQARVIQAATNAAASALCMAPSHAGDTSARLFCAFVDRNDVAVFFINAATLETRTARIACSPPRAIACAPPDASGRGDGALPIARAFATIDATHLHLWSDVESARARTAGPEASVVLPVLDARWSHILLAVAPARFVVISRTDHTVAWRENGAWQTRTYLSVGRYAAHKACVLSSGYVVVAETPDDDGGEADLASYRVDADNTPVRIDSLDIRIDEAML